MTRLTIRRIHDLVGSLDYFISIHAAEELDDDDLTIFDLESTLLTGEIIRRQRDRETREIKCVVRGLTLDGRQAETVVKIGPSGKLFVITAYLV